MGYRILLILILACTQVNAQMLCNGWRFGGSAPSFPTTNFLFGYAGDNGVTQSSNVVSAWDDMSTNNRDATQATAGNRPDWNGTDAITFVRANSDYMTVAYAPSGALNFYMVLKINNLTNNCYLWGEFGAFFAAFDGTTDKIGVTDGTTTINQSGTIANTSTYYLVHIHIESGTNASYIAINNGSNTTGTLSSGPFGSPFYLGALKFSGSPFDYADATFKAFRCYGTQNSTDIANTKAAFNAKYSLY